MYDYSFLRVEEKYLISSKTKKELLSKIKDYLTKDKYYISNIHNIYFDTLNNDLIINSLEKPVFKDKFRARCYGDMSKDSYIFLETKTKYNDIVSKRRIKIKLKDFNNYIKGKNININNQVFKEIDYYFKYYNMKPSIYIAYDRESYIGKYDDSLRITFDNNLRSRRNNLEFKENIKMQPYFKEDYYIMEIKSIYSMPLWLVKILSSMNILPISFSKYGSIYKKELEMRVINYV